MRIKNTKHNVFFFLSVFFFFLTVVVFISKYSSHSENIKNTCNWFLETAIYQTNSNDVDKLEGRFDRGRVPTKEEQYRSRIRDFEDNNIKYDHYEDSILYFTESDEWDYRTVLLDGGEEGALFFARKVPKRPGIRDYLIYESHQLQKGQVDLDAIAERYREILREKNINIDTPIYLSVSSDIQDVTYKNFEDTKSINYNHITPVFFTGYLNEVMYQAYLYIPFKIVFKSIAQTWFNLFFGILITLLIITTYLYIDDYIERRKIGIICLKRGQYYKIGHLLFSFTEQTLTYKKEQYRFSPRIGDILLFILEDEDHTISKDALINMLTSESNVTSFISLIRKLLLQSKCIYELRYEKKNKLYRLQLKAEGGKEPTDDTPDLTSSEQ